MASGLNELLMLFVPNRYNKDLLPPTVGVTLETDPNYEILPFMQSMKSHNDQVTKNFCA